MHKIILMLLLAAVSSSAMAEWVMVSQSKETTAYFNPSTIKKKGEKVKMWDMLDFRRADKTDDGKTFISNMAQDEFDCSEEQSRNLYSSGYSENMGKGVIVFHYSINGEWVPIVPDSI